MACPLLLLDNSTSPAQPPFIKASFLALDHPLICLSRWKASSLVENWPLFQDVDVPYMIRAVGTAEHVNVVSQSGAILVHFIAPCDPQAAQSFDRLRMMVGGRE